MINQERIGMTGFSLGGYTTLALAGADIDCNLLKSEMYTNAGKNDFIIPEMGDLRPLYAKLNCDSLQKSYKDRRIKVFVAMSPALGLGFKNFSQTKSVDAPVLIIGAENDKVAPIQYNAENIIV